jgi:trk system potassium uptake protein
VVAEMRGRPDSEAFGRRVCLPAQRQAITVLVLGSAWWCWARWSSCA